MRFKSFSRMSLIMLAIITVFTVTVFATSESGTLGRRGDYIFECDNGNIFSKYVEASSEASYNGNTGMANENSTTRYVFTDGRARVDVVLDDGTNNTNFEDFDGIDFVGNAYVKVHGLNKGSADCYARVTGLYVYTDGTYSPTNDIKALKLEP